ncbi:MAG: RsmB/NOP family class I SAM-dependent RNA methyltransferase [Flavobacteriaceae bacterium]|nr:RsmB/NOP family class I SAM-dependent RNA methyltransferase [Flavobacteriaceae bacterium]
MRLHRNLVLAIADAFHQICNTSLYADKVIERILKKDKRWGARDRAFIAENTYELVRYRRWYAAAAEVDSFDTSSIWKMIGTRFVLEGYPLPDWPEFFKVNPKKITERAKKLSKNPKIAESFPDWLYYLGIESLGEAFWLKEIHALNQQAPVILRTNSLKIGRNDLLQQLNKENIASRAVTGSNVGVILEEKSNIFNTEAFKNGYFEVQDTASQLVSEFAEPSSSDCVVDACAGAGGKSLHLAALMQNKGQIIALDIYDKKLIELKRRARRAGAHNVEPRLITSSKVIKKLNNRADITLIDAPCSGLGVLRRNPDTKWKLSPEKLQELIATQQELLQSYSTMVKPGGKLIYVTCSILPEENKQQIDYFLNSEAGKSFNFVEEKKIFAHINGTDGFYMCKLQKQ